METATLFLVLFAAWTLVLACSVVLWRVFSILHGTPTTIFIAGTPHSDKGEALRPESAGNSAYWRLNRAHLNALEGLAPFAALVLVAAHRGLDGDRAVVLLAKAIFCSRIAQSAVHVASGASFAVQLRFGFFATQMACLFLLAGKLIGGAVPWIDTAVAFVVQQIS
jgi:uncharacterized MAPEG superfamily protein